MTGCATGGEDNWNSTAVDDDEDIIVTVPAQGPVGLDDFETLLQSDGDTPGARTSLTTTTNAGTWSHPIRQPSSTEPSTPTSPTFPCGTRRRRLAQSW
jgi:hypothetical protein